jgi:hypothetical protein
MERPAVGRPILGIGGQVEYAAAAFHPAVQRIRVRNVAADDFHQFVFLRAGLVGAEAGRGIDGVAPAERPHAEAPLDQGLNQPRADKPRGPGNEDSLLLIHAEGSFGAGMERLLYSRRAAHHNGECIVCPRFGEDQVRWGLRKTDPSTASRPNPPRPASREQERIDEHAGVCFARFQSDRSRP